MTESPSRIPGDFLSFTYNPIKDRQKNEHTHINLCFQIRRALHRLQDMLSVVEKNMLSLQQNCSSVTEEVDEIYRRLAKALKDRTEFLRGKITCHFFSVIA